MGLYTDIRQSLVSVSKNPDKSICGEFNFASDLEMFRGHFPGNPILPGIAQIEMVKCLVEMVLEKKLTLREIQKTKFSHMIQPETPVSVTITLPPPMEAPRKNPDIQVKAGVRIPGSPAGKINMTLS